MAKESPQSPQTSAENPFAPMARLQQAGFGGWIQLNAAWLEAMGEMGAELASFISDRVKEDVKTQHQLLHCKDMDEARRIQENFVQKAVDQYQAETGKLVEMGMSVFSAGNGKTPKSS